MTPEETIDAFIEKAKAEKTAKTIFYAHPSSLVAILGCRKSTVFCEKLYKHLAGCSNSKAKKTVRRIKRNESKSVCLCNQIQTWNGIPIVKSDGKV